MITNVSLLITLFSKLNESCWFCVGMQRACSAGERLFIVKSAYLLLLRRIFVFTPKSWKQASLMPFGSVNGLFADALEKVKNVPGFFVYTMLAASFMPDLNWR